MSKLLEINEIELALKNLGTIEDMSNHILEKFKVDMPYSYYVYENKYDYTAYDYICVDVYSNGTFAVTNEDIPFEISNVKDTLKLKRLFKKTNFSIETFHDRVEVTAKANTIEQVIGAVNEYRKCNAIFLKDKFEKMES